MSENNTFVVPTQWGSFELVEQKSRFIGQVWQVHSEEEAREHLEATRKRYHDARHHCWCYRINEQLVRYSDDGEPQGTAGQPMLHVFTQENVEQVCCVVTRYFGGTKLGTGGLVRAYSHCAKGAFAQAGTSAYQQFDVYEIITPYPLFETVQKVIVECDGVVVETNYGADVEVRTQIPHADGNRFLENLTEYTSGQVLAEQAGVVSLLSPVNEDEVE